MPGRWLVAAAMALVGAAAPARGGPPDAGVELTPFIGYRFGGNLGGVEGALRAEVAEGTSYGIMLDFQVEEGGFIELRYSHQSTEVDATGSSLGPGQVKVTELDVEHFFFGGTYQWETRAPVQPFVSADLGAVRFDAPGFNAETEFGFSLGGGVKLPMGKRVGLRFDGRWVTTILNPNTEFYCNSAGYCIVVAHGTYFGQAEVSGGITFRF